MSATRAIVWGRFRLLWPAALILLVSSLAVGWMQQNSLSIFAHNTRVSAAQPILWLIGPLLYTTLAAIVIAYANTRRTSGDPFAFCEECAPLFGRQRARAAALLPVIVIFACSAAEYAGARANPNYGTPPTFFLFDAIGAVSAMLVALSIPLREPFGKALYVVLAFGSSMVCGAIVVAVTMLTNPAAVSAQGRYYVSFNDLWGGTAELAFAILIGFIALRQYGEALARFDPLP